MEKILRTRPKASYSSEALKEISLLSFTDQGAVPFGSSVYVVQKYPGDIDTYEHVITKGPIKKACKRIAEEMQNVVLRLTSAPDHWVTDIKAGIDKDWDLSIGELYRGNWTPNQENLKWIIDHVVPEDAEQIVQFICGQMRTGADAYDNIDKIVREYKIIRWTPSSLIDGRIKKNGKTIKLVDALCGNSQVKIDSVSIIDGAYVEATNMLFLGYVEDGKINPINTSYNFLNPVEVRMQYDETLRQEIEKLFYSNVWYSPFKGAKRMWAYSRVRWISGESRERWARYLEILTPLISGNVSLLYQIKSEAATIELVKDKVPKKIVNRWKTSISRIPELSNSEMDNLLVLCDHSHVNGASERGSGDLQTALKTIIANASINYLRDHGLFPLHRSFLPERPKYCSFSC